MQIVLKEIRGRVAAFWSNTLLKVLCKRINGPKFDIGIQNKDKVILEHPNQLCVRQPLAPSKSQTAQYSCTSSCNSNYYLFPSLLCLQLYQMLGIRVAVPSTTKLLYESLYFFFSKMPAVSTVSSIQRSATLDSDYNLSWKVREQITQTRLAGG